MRKQYEKKNVWEKSNDAYSLSKGVQTTINNISICFYHNINIKENVFLQSASWKKVLRAWHIDASSVVWTLIYNGKLANLIARLAAIVVKNGFPCFSFGFISHIVGKLALQDATFSVIIVNSWVVKFGFLFTFFYTVSGKLFRVHVYTDTENFVLHSLRSALTQGSPCALHLISLQTCLWGGNPLCWKIYS